LNKSKKKTKEMSDNLSKEQMLQKQIDIQKKKLAIEEMELRMMQMQMQNQQPQMQNRQPQMQNRQPQMQNRQPQMQNQQPQMQNQQPQKGNQQPQMQNQQPQKGNQQPPQYGKTPVVLPRSKQEGQGRVGDTTTTRTDEQDACSGPTMKPCGRSGCRHMIKIGTFCTPCFHKMNDRCKCGGWKEKTSEMCDKCSTSGHKKQSGQPPVHPQRKIANRGGDGSSTDDEDQNEYVPCGRMKGDDKCTNLKPVERPTCINCFRETHNKCSGPICKGMKWKEKTREMCFKCFESATKCPRCGWVLKEGEKCGCVQCWKCADRGETGYCPEKYVVVSNAGERIGLCLKDTREDAMKS